MRENLKEKFLQYLFSGEDILEFSMFSIDEKFYKQVLEEYGSWQSFIKDVGVLERHAREVERFNVYWRLKLRYERFGPESMRHKNIETGVKDFARRNFGSTKRLTKDLIVDQKDESVIYDMHAMLISGCDVQEMLENDQEMRDRIRREYKDKLHFLEEYRKRFPIDLIDPIDHKEEEEEKRVTGEGVTVGVDVLVQLGYITEEEASELKEKDSNERLVN